MDTKTCDRCGGTFTFDLLEQNATTGHYLRRCKDCAKTVRRERARLRTTEQRQAEREKARAKQGKAYTPGWHEAAKERTTRKATTYIKRGPAFERHMDKLAERNAYEAFDWWIRCKASDETVQAFYADRPWANPRLSSSEQYRLRYRLDPAFNAQERLRRQIKKAAQRDGVAESIRLAIRRNGSSPFMERELGYTIAHLRAHIERQFHDGMTWQAFIAGEIHIDHIKPKDSFDLSVHSEWVECWSLSNLRPLWAKDNLAKSNKQTHLL